MFLNLMAKKHLKSMRWPVHREWNNYERDCKSKREMHMGLPCGEVWVVRGSYFIFSINNELVRTETNFVLCEFAVSSL